MLDGENCIRCNRKKRFEELTVGPAGFSICKDCAAKISLDAQEKHHCPVDNEALVKGVFGIVLVEKCVSCGGVWFDAEELRIFNDFIKREVWAKSVTLEILFP
jgi:Transcription factor zinc-finger